MRVLNDLNTYVTVAVLLAVYLTASPEDEYKWWISLVDNLPSAWSDRVKFVAIAQVALESAFWFLVINLSMLERAGLLEKYRIQPIPTSPEQLARDQALTREAFRGVLLSHWLIRPIVFYLAFPLFEARAGPLRATLPSVRSLFVQVMGCMLVDDTWFYFWHRLFHAVPWLYRAVHKQHHKFYRPNVFATEFAHPLEDIWVNSLGTILGPVLLGVHPFLLIVYPAMKLYQSMEAHSGFNIPFPFSVTSVIDSMDCAPAHDFHHSHIVSNYGGWFMFLDWAFGTDISYENHIMIKRKDDPVYESARRPYQHDRIGLVVRQGLPHEEETSSVG